MKIIDKVKTTDENKLKSDLQSSSKRHFFGIALISISELHSFEIRNYTHFENNPNALSQADTTND